MISFPESIVHNYQEYPDSIIFRRGLWAIVQVGNVYGLYADDDGVYYQCAVFSENHVLDLRNIIMELFSSFGVQKVRKLMAQNRDAV